MLLSCLSVYLRTGLAEDAELRCSCSSPWNCEAFNKPSKRSRRGTTGVSSRVSVTLLRRYRAGLSGCASVPSPEEEGCASMLQRSNELDCETALRASVCVSVTSTAWSSYLPLIVSRVGSVLRFLAAGSEVAGAGAGASVCFGFAEGSKRCKSSLGISSRWYCGSGSGTEQTSMSDDEAVASAILCGCLDCGGGVRNGAEGNREGREARRRASKDRKTNTWTQFKGASSRVALTELR